jgi:hypothetical protein
MRRNDASFRGFFGAEFALREAKEHPRRMILGVDSRNWHMRNQLNSSLSEPDSKLRI